MLTLEEILKLDPNSVETLFIVNDFVSELIPIFHSSPYRVGEGDTVESLYESFKKKELGGWCSLSAEYLVMVLNKMDISARVYNYGLPDTEFTHMTVLAGGYLLDPYFNKHFADFEGNALQFERLKRWLIDSSSPFQAIYGASLKTKRVDEEGAHKFVTLTGEEWYKSLLDSWWKKGLEDVLLRTFGKADPHLLMLRGAATTHPFPHIPELGAVPEARNLKDVLALQEFVFSTIPYTKDPLEDIGSFTLAYRGFKKREIGGWCGLNAEYFRRLLICYGVKVRPYNYGLVSTRFTHVCVIVNFDGIEYLLDPYFNKIYTYKDDFPLPFQDLLRLIQKGETSCITSQFGSGKKPVWHEDLEDFVPESGDSFENNVFDFFQSIGLNESLMDVFGYVNPLALLLIKIPDKMR